MGIGRTLSPEQEEEIFNLVCSMKHWELDSKLFDKGAKHYLWTRSAVMELIKQKFNIVLTNAGVVKYLKRWGFPSAKRPNIACTGLNQELKNWLQEHYENIVQRATPEMATPTTKKAKIFWVSRTVLENKLTLISAITTQGKVHWRIFTGQFNPKQQIKFMSALIRENRSKVFLIREDLKYYAKDEVMEWLGKHEGKIELFPPQDWNS